MVYFFLENSTTDGVITHKSGRGVLYRSRPLACGAVWLSNSL